jgi:hypothetical protein
LAGERNVFAGGSAATHGGAAAAAVAFMPLRACRMGTGLRSGAKTARRRPHVTGGRVGFWNFLSFTTELA